MTPKQEEALRDYLQEAIVPLIEQVLVKKLGQAMTFAAQEVVSPQRKPLTDERIESIFRDHGWSWGKRADMYIPVARAIEVAHGIKENT